MSEARPPESHLSIAYPEGTVRWVARMFLVGGAAFTAAWSIAFACTLEWRLVSAIAPALGAAVVGIVALRLLARRRAQSAVILMAAAMGTSGIYGSVLVPQLRDMALGQLALAATLTVPHLSDRAFRRALGAWLVVAVVVAVQGGLRADHGVLPAFASEWAHRIGTPAVWIAEVLAVVYVAGQLRAVRAESRESARVVATQAKLLRSSIVEIDDERRRATDAVIARRAAEAAAEARSAFLANMSHEIRTPMNAVIGMTEMLVRTELDAKQREYASTIRSSGEHLLSIINDILDLSKLEAGKVKLDPAPFDLPVCVEAALDLVAHAAALKGIELAYSFSPDAPRSVVADANRVRQVLVNLVGNAVKFTRSGSVTVRVSRLALSPPEPGRLAGAGPAGVRVSVADTGVGLTAEQIATLFRPFTQVDSTSTREFGGTGLGLAISKQIVELLGGSITVESKPGIGSTFSFTFVAAPDVERSAEKDAELVRDDALVGARVLVVDDSDASRAAVISAANEWGMKPIGARSAAEASTHFGEGIDLAIIDRHMPGTDGLALAKAMRTDPRTDTVPMVLLGHEDPPDASRAWFTAVLRKPVERSSLFDAMMASLGGRKRRTTGGKDVDPSMAVRHPLRILVAEDNELNQKMAAYMLDALGYTAEQAKTGVEAHEAVIDGDYDLVFMDLHMPDMDGIDAARLIRERMADGDRPRIIALTAAVMEEDRERVAAVMDGFLAKPLAMRSLIAALEAAQPTARSRRSVAAASEAAVVAALKAAGAGSYRSKLQRLVAEVADVVPRLVEREPAVIAETASQLEASALDLGATEVARNLRILAVRGKRKHLKGIEKDLRGATDAVDRFEREVAARLAGAPT